MHLFFNIIIFFIVLNFNWFADKIKGRPNRKSAGDLFTVPILMGITLTIVDNLRIFFIYRLLIFIILALIIYLAVSKYKNFLAKK
jgi:hypothetical protein